MVQLHNIVLTSLPTLAAACKGVRLMMKSFAIIFILITYSNLALSHGEQVCMTMGSSTYLEYIEDKGVNLSHKIFSEENITIGAYFDAAFTTVELTSFGETYPIKMVSENIYITKTKIKKYQLPAILTFTSSRLDRAILTVGGSYVEYYDCFQVN